MVRSFLSMLIQAENCPLIHLYRWISGALNRKCLMIFSDSFTDILKNIPMRKKLSFIFPRLYHHSLLAIRKHAKYLILRKVGLALHTTKIKQASANQSIDSFKNESILMFFFRYLWIMLVKTVLIRCVRRLLILESFEEGQTRYSSRVILRHHRIRYTINFRLMSNLSNILMEQNKNFNSYELALLILFKK